MTCSLKTMATLAATLLAALGIAYVAFPAAQAFIVVSAPALLALIRPVAMIAMMLTLRGRGASATDAAPKDEVPSRSKMPEVLQER